MPPKSAGTTRFEIQAHVVDPFKAMAEGIEEALLGLTGPLVRAQNAKMIERVQREPPAIVLEFGQRKGAACDAFCRELAGAEERERCSRRPRYITLWDVNLLAEAAWRSTR